MPPTSLVHCAKQSLPTAGTRTISIDVLPRSSALTMAFPVPRNMHISCAMLYAFVVVLLTSHHAFSKTFGVGAATTHGEACETDTVGVLKPTPVVAMPIDLIPALGKIQALNFPNFESTVNHGVARATVELPSYTTFTASTCRAAGFICDEFVAVPPYTNANRASNAQSQATVRAPHIHTINDFQVDFFLESSLQVGSEVSLDKNLRSPFPTRRFLPKSISESIPALKTEKLAKLLSTFRIRNGTPMASIIATAAYLCGSPALPGEERECHTSFEGMAEFATSKLGADNVRILATTGAPAEDSKFATTKVAGFHKRSIAEGKHVVVCHEIMFPTALQYCHLVHGTKIVQVSLETNSLPKNQIQAIAICHLNTTMWLSRHPAFAALNIAKGEEACHFLSEGDIVWVANSDPGDV